MFDRLYEGAMRRGSRLLFAIAVLLFLAGLVSTFIFASASASPYEQSRAEWPAVLAQLMSAGSFAVMPLFAALLIDRIDLWLGRKDAREPTV
jgi:ABC-type transport system involved in cytochrome c biogenesis permease subunit